MPDQKPLVAVVMGSTSDWETMKHAVDVLEQFGVPQEHHVVSAHRTPVWMAEFATGAESRGIEVIIAGAGGAAHLPGMVAAHTVVPVLGVPQEHHVVSAHRTPLWMAEFAGGAEARGIEVIIAGAGGAAHLPGMVASATTLPVIGVPVPLKHLDGMDSLLSIVQMPTGIPVATVSIGGARNAGLLAVRMLAMSDENLRARLADFAGQLANLVVEKDAKLRASLDVTSDSSPDPGVNGR